jgi:SPP1 family predicted phage head-tail adaptor
MPYQTPRIPIGARRERVSIQEAVTTDDGLGGQSVIRWQTIGEPWAQVVALDERTKEAMAAQGLTARHAYHVAIPYRTDVSVSPTLRLIVRDTTMQVHSVTDDEGRRRRQILYVGEVTR